MDYNIPNLGIIFREQQGNNMIEEKMLDFDDACLFLSGVKIFLDLDNQVIENLAENMKMFRFADREYLIEKGKPGQYMMLVKEGDIRVLLERDVVDLEKGAVVGEMSLLSGKPSKADVMAMSETIVLALARKDFTTLMTLHPSLAVAMTRLMKERLDNKGDIQRVGKYQILGKLGEGGMSIVYNAFDPNLEREVAIKMLNYEVATATDFKDRFKEEAKTIAKLQHPNILHVFETISEFSTDFIVMEKLDGKDLKQCLAERGVFSASRAQGIISQVAKALAFSHQEGILHRDVKLANIVLSDDGHAKLMDFGIATKCGDEASHHGGTIQYISPEVIKGKGVDHRVDIYALGITAFAMLTGETPFAAPEMKEIIKGHVYTRPTDIVQLVPDISPQFAEFINRALIKNPQERISDWAEIRTLLGETNADCGQEAGFFDLTLTIQMETIGQDTGQIIREIRQILKKNQVNHILDMSSPN
jgi:eukaryotic-like serine/threonine-protein kinase